MNKLVERTLVLVFVVLSQWAAIGFLVAAKSILRFSEASSGREKSEYVLTGTLLSLTLAIFIGLVVVSWMTIAAAVTAIVRYNRMATAHPLPVDLPLGGLKRLNVVRE